MRFLTSGGGRRAEGTQYVERALRDNRTSDPIKVGVAGGILGQYGLMMSAVFRGNFQVDYVLLAETFLTKAQALDPANPDWSSSLEHFRKLQSETAKPK